MAENVEPNETPAEDAPEVVAHVESPVGWCGIHQEVAEEPEVIAHSGRPSAGAVCTRRRPRPRSPR